MDNLNKDNRLEILKKYVDFLDIDFKGIGLYELVIGIFYLLNFEEEFNNIQKLIKAQNKIEIIKKVWNVSWDITFLRFINDNSHSLLSDDDALIKCNCILVTKDRTLAETAGVLNIESVVVENERIPSIIIDENKIKSQYLASYLEIYNDIMSLEKFNRRMGFLRSLDPDQEIQRYIKLTDDITNRLRNNKSN